jgi:hypothetical protein
MSSVVISGDTSGAVTVAAPAVSGTNTLTLQAATATSAVNTLGTVNAGGTNPFPSSGGPTVVDFTGLPSWIKKITVMFSGVSTNGTSVIIIQIGDSGGIENTSYASCGSTIGSSSAGSSAYTTGFGIGQGNAAGNIHSGAIALTLVGSNIFTCFGGTASTDGSVIKFTSGTKTLSDTLDRVRITTVGGTETFDAGTVNILYEG